MSEFGFPPCLLPPKGWICTRDPNHDGPCAAVPVEGDAADQIHRLKIALKEWHRGYARLLRTDGGDPS